MGFFNLSIFTVMEALFNPLFITLGSCGILFIAMGFVMSKKPPKEINGMYGYRTPIAMKNQNKHIDLSKISKELPFRVPDNYFEELPGKIQTSLDM